MRFCQSPKRVADNAESYRVHSIAKPVETEQLPLPRGHSNFVDGVVCQCHLSREDRVDGAAVIDLLPEINAVFIRQSVVRAIIDDVSGLGFPSTKLVVRKRRRHWQ